MNNEKMNILVLGGTGAIGVPLVNNLSKKGYLVKVTSRKAHENYDNIQYIVGNSRDNKFLKELLKEKWYAIIDFMSYSTDEFKERYEVLLNNTSQYVFISSARVYAESNIAITEDTPRLLDVSKDLEYLKTDEYALSKARQENLLKQSTANNWTVIRPTITYSNIRLQLGVLEKENWLYRALHGRSIVFSNDIADKLTTMTHSLDVALGIESIIGNPSALGEIFHITSDQSYTWNEILTSYLDVIEAKVGIRPNVIMTDKSVKLKEEGSKYQVIYSRYFNRKFDNTKVRKYVNVDEFTDPKVGLQAALNEFLQKPEFRTINWRLEAWNDQAAGERTPLCEIPSLKNKLLYLSYRYNFDFIMNIYKKLKRQIKK